MWKPHKWWWIENDIKNESKPAYIPCHLNTFALWKRSLIRKSSIFIRMSRLSDFCAQLVDNRTDFQWCIKTSLPSVWKEDIFQVRYTFKEGCIKIDFSFHFYLTLSHVIAEVEILYNSNFLILFLLFNWELFMAPLYVLPLKQMFCVFIHFHLSFAFFTLYMRHYPQSYWLSVKFIKHFSRQVSPFHFLELGSPVLYLRIKNFYSLIIKICVLFIVTY